MDTKRFPTLAVRVCPRSTATTLVLAQFITGIHQPIVQSGGRSCRIVKETWSTFSQKDKNLFEKKGHPCNGTEPCDFILELLVQVENKSKWNPITHIPLVNAEQRVMSVTMEILFVTFCSHVGCHYGQCSCHCKTFALEANEHYRFIRIFLYYLR